MLPGMQLKTTNKLSKANSVSSGAVKRSSSIETSVEPRSRPRPGSFNAVNKPALKDPGLGLERGSTLVSILLLLFTAPLDTELAFDSLRDIGFDLKALGFDSSSSSSSSLSRSNSVTNQMSAIMLPPSPHLSSSPIGFNLPADMFAHAPHKVPLHAPPQPTTTAFNAHPPGFKFTKVVGDQSRSSLSTQGAGSAFNGTPMLQDTCGSSAASGLDVLKVVEKRDNSNLIDLTLFDNGDMMPPRGGGGGGERGVRVSLLEAFDPLLISAGGQAAAAGGSGCSKVARSEEDVTLI
ncbi:hypothetical protein LSTR_LSTR014158 [Laodelphax striatellus]|uniref:Uncharacterized protein n=1 Tax=Laodelphax striatellus TaxID=195883 RepID=A0A482XUI2_LAOST|nr:hypothetical protein LSTR_LSTR014158 [Laodelphax striatellus]